MAPTNTSRTLDTKTCNKRSSRDLLHMVDLAIGLAERENQQFVMYLLAMARQEIVDQSN